MQSRVDEPSIWWDRDFYVSPSLDKLTICLISAEYPPDRRSGGIGTYTHQLAHGLAARGHSIHVVSVSTTGRDVSSMDGQVNVHRIADRQRTLPRRLESLTETWHSLDRSISVASALKRLHKAIGFDIVEAPNWGAESLVYGLHPATPLILRVVTPLSVTATHNDDLHGLRPGLRARLGMERLAARRATQIIACSSYIAQVVTRIYDVPNKAILVVPLGIEIPATPLSPLSTEHTTVLYVGRLEWRKGTRYLLEAIPGIVAAVPSARFQIIGRDMEDSLLGSYQDYFASFATPEAQAATTFVGFVDREELDRAYAACSVFVAPSLFESFGLIHLEAMARAKPVVACRAAATPEVVVDGETGYLVPPEDSVLLAEAIVDLLRRPDKARAMGAKGLQRAQSEFTLDRVVENTLKVYRNVLSSRRA